MRAISAILGVILVAAVAARAEVIDRVVALVNDEVITLSEVEEAAADSLSEVAAEPDPVARQQKKQRQLRAFLDAIIGERLVKQEAAKAHVVVREDEVKDHLEKVMAQQGWDDARLGQYLGAQGLTLAKFKDQVREQLLQRKVVGRFLRDKIALSDRDVQNYCRERRTQAGAHGVEAAHIVLRVSAEATPAEDSAIRQKAEEIRDRAVAGEDFAALARQYSDIGGDSGGTLGTVKRGDLADKTLEKAIFSTPVGGVGGPVRTAVGYHIVRAIAKKAAPGADCDTVDPETRNELYQSRLADAMAAWVRDLEKKAFIEKRL